MNARIGNGRPAGGAILACLALAAIASGCAHLPLVGRATATKAKSAPPLATVAAAPAAHEPEALTSRETRDLREAREQAALNPGHPYWHTEIARLLLASDSTATAEAELRAARGCDPAYAPALALTSSLWYRQRRHAEAITLLEPLRATMNTATPPPPALMAGLALHYDAIDRPDLARAVLLDLTPADQKRAGSSAVYVTMRGETPETANDLADSVVDRDGKSAVNQNNYGIAKLRAGDPKAARKAFLAAIDRDPSLPGPYYNLAILERFYALDDAAGARWFAEYRRRSQDDPDQLAEIFGRPEPGRNLAGQEGQP
jgi:tetratricopeptide (TPR) repeat protein